MPEIINALLNLGGTGVLAAALLWLHREAIHAFREELATERRLWLGTVAAEREIADRRHEAIMAQLDHLGDRLPTKARS